MQNASNQMCGDPWLKNGCATNFETWPRFRVTFYFYFYTDLFNVILLYIFCKQKRRRLLKQILSMTLLKRPAAGATFECLHRRQKELIPSI